MVQCSVYVLLMLCPSIELHDALPWGVADSVPPDKSAILGVGTNYNLASGSHPLPPAKESVNRHIHVSDPSCKSVPTSVPISAIAILFGPAQSAQSLGSVKPGCICEAVVWDAPVGHGVSWFTILILGASGDPLTMTAIPGSVHKCQHTLAGLTYPVATLPHRVKEALGDLEGTYVYDNKILISTSTREAHNAMLREVWACLQESALHGLFQSTRGATAGPHPRPTQRHHVTANPSTANA